MRKIILSLLIVGLWSFAVAQNEPSSPFHDNVIPPSPEAASIAEFGAVPVNYNVGAANVSIPIYTIKGNEIQLPISLSYDPKGIRVDEIAGSTGLGWSLNSGGVISRSVRGRPDEHQDGFFDEYEYWLTVKDQNYTMATHETSAKYQFEMEVARGEKDLLPDAFAFNFGQYSGTFSFKYDENATGSFKYRPVVTPSQDIKIEWPENFAPGSSLNFFQIITPDGIKYKFSTLELIDTQSNNNTLVSSWWLTNITSPSNEQISFTYQSTGKGYQQFEDFKISSTTLDVKQSFGGTGEDCILPSFNYQPTDLPDLVDPKLIHSIAYNPNTANGNTTPISVLFNRTPAANIRCDLPANYIGMDPITSINITAGSYSEVVSLGYGNYGTPCTGVIDTKKRMRLETVTVQNLGTYALDYRESTINALGSMTDHWGFHNYAPNNGSFIPALTTEQEYTYINNGACIANREANAAGSITGLLEKMTYPTGGYTLFEYEANSNNQIVDNYPLVQIETAKAYGNSTQHGTMNSLETQVRNLWDNGDIQLLGGPPRVRVSDVMNVNNGSAVKVTSSIYDSSNPSAIFAAPTTTRIYELPITDIDVYEVALTNNTTEVILGNGQYVIVSAVAEDLTTVVAEMTVEYTEIMNDYFLAETIGGARLKKMTNHDDISSANDVVTEFFYVDNYIQYLKDLDDYNNGVTFIAPIAENSSVVHFRPQYFDTNICGGLVASAYNQEPFGISKGYHIGYSEVAEVKSGSENGITVHKFVNTANPEFRSQQSEVLQYDEDLNLVAQTQSIYGDWEYSEAVTAYKPKIREVVLFKSVPGGGNQGGSNTINQYYYVVEDRLSLTNYNSSSFWKPLIGTVQTTWNADGTRSMTQTSNYSYYTDNYSLTNQVRYQLLKESSTSTSDGDIMISRFKYPPEMTGTPYANMLLDHNYNYLVERESFLSDGTIETKLSGMKYDFTKYSDVYRATSESVWNRDSDAYELERGSNYSPSGRNLEELLSSRGNMTTAMLWDDREISPIAQFSNAAWDEVAYTGFEDYQLYDWNYSASGLESASTILGGTAYDLSSGALSLSKSLVNGDYVVRFKARNGSASVGGSAQVFGSDWEVKEFEFTTPTVLNISGSAEIDEVRVYPKNRNVSFRSVQLQDHIGVVAENDDNTGLVRYYYDQFGRLISVRDKDGNVLKQNIYNYKN